MDNINDLQNLMLILASPASGLIRTLPQNVRLNQNDPSCSYCNQEPAGKETQILSL